MCFFILREKEMSEKKEKRSFQKEEQKEMRKKCDEDEE